MDKKQLSVLIVDDEPDILEFLTYNLSRENFAISTAKDGLEALHVARNIKPDLIILDIMMPGMDGIEVCNELRKEAAFNDTIIILLTARCEDYSQVAGFEAGADDYICKPVKPRVLVSRINAIMKRVSQPKSARLTYSDTKVSVELVIDKEKYLVFYQGVVYNLPRKEFELLSLLASKPEKVFTRDEIYRKIWGNNIVVGNRTIDVHIRKIRTKLKADFIRTIKGVGYKFLEQ
jgi:two-component system alkaline phosphatase synthesis response regulator PhoP